MKQKNILTMSFWAALFFIAGIRANAQTGPAPEGECLTEATASIYRQFLDDIPRLRAFSAGAAAGRGAEQAVPVYFTVFRDDDGSFAGREVDESLISEALARLDSLFAPINLHFVQCGEVNYIDHSGLAEFNAHRHLMELSYISTALNVYTRSGTGSFAQFPGNVNPNSNTPTSAVDSRNNLLSLSSSSYLDPTFAHEAGHSFGLVHTFEGARVYNNPSNPTPGYHSGFQDHPYGAYNDNSWRRELVLRTPDSTLSFARPNAGLSGDFVEDTPAFCKLSNTYFPNWAAADCQDYPFSGSSCTGCIVRNCNYEGDYIDYNGHELQDTEASIRNIMSYTGSCRREFTPGQYERMAYYNATVRSRQYDATLCVNLKDEVCYEGTQTGIGDVLIMLSHGDTHRRCNTITNTGGQFQGIAYSPAASAYVMKVGSNPDPGYDDNPDDYIAPSTRVVLENSYATEDWLEGVSIKDALLLHQYLMGNYPLNGYKQIAADLDNDGSITLQDSWLMLSLLAGDITKFPGQRSPWRFVPEYIPERYPASFHSGPFDMTIGGISYSQYAPYLEEGWVFEIADGMSGKNGFDGIKLGDLDGSNISAPAPAQFRGCPEGNPAFLYEQLPLAAGQAIELDIRPAGSEALSAFQIGFRIDTRLVELAGIHPAGLPGFAVERNVGRTGEAGREIKVAWVSEDARPQQLDQEEALFRLVLKAKKALPGLQGALQLDSTLLRPEFFTESGCSLPLKLLVGPARAAGKREAAGRHQEGRLWCYPNPAGEQISLAFPSETGGPGLISIYNTLGHFVKEQEVSCQAGWNEIQLSLDGLPSGLYFLSLEGPGGSYVSKFCKAD